MATTTQTITSLINSRNALAKETDGLSPTSSQYLWTAIDDINTEIDELTANALATADYVPQTDPFKAVTNEGKAFIGTLNDIKGIFSTAAAVVAAATSVLNIILGL